MATTTLCPWLGRSNAICGAAVATVVVVAAAAAVGRPLPTVDRLPTFRCGMWRGVVWCGPGPRRRQLVLMLLPPSLPSIAVYVSFGRLCMLFVVVFYICGFLYVVANARPSRCTKL